MDTIIEQKNHNYEKNIEHTITNNNNVHFEKNIDCSDDVDDIDIVDNIDNEKLDKQIEQSIVDILFEKLQLQFNNSQQIIKTLQNNVKILHKEVLKERKNLNKKITKNNKKKKKRNSLSGFAIPTKISKELATFLNIDENEKISRTSVTSLTCKYVKDNNLQNPDNKKIIIPDDKLKTLFAGYLSDDTQLEFFNIQSYLKYHFIK